MSPTSCGLGVRQSNDIDMDRHYSNSVNIQSLEAVFLKLAYELSKRRDKDVEDIPDEKKHHCPEVFSLTQYMTCLIMCFVYVASYIQ